MKRAITFLVILCLILTIIVTTEYFYSRNLKALTREIIKACETDNNFYLCAKKLGDIMSKRKVINRLFYSRDTAEKIEIEIEKLNIYASQKQVSDAKSQLKSIKFLYKTLFRFNASEG